ncbi:CAP domain-containing protein [Bacillus sp. AK128]
MNRIYLLLLIFILVSLVGCNGAASDEAGKRNDLMTGQQVNHHPAQDTNNTETSQLGTVRNVGNAGPRGLGDVLEPNPMSDFFIADVIDLTNEERRRHGLSQLTADLDLQKAAQLKAEDMSNQHELSYHSQVYGSPFDMLRSLGINYKEASENIAQGPQSAREVMDAWMNHPEYRENILNPDITHIGVGYDTSGDYWTQILVGK